MNTEAEAEAQAAVLRANGMARELTMAALLGRDDPGMGVLLVELMSDAAADPEIALVLLRLAHLAADGLAARVQLEELRGDPNADQIVRRLFLTDAAVELGVITS